MRVNCRQVCPSSPARSDLARSFPVFPRFACMIRVTWHRPLVSRGWSVVSLTPTWHYQARPHGVSQYKCIAVYMFIPTLTWSILADTEHSGARRCTSSRGSHGRLAREKVRYGYRVRSRSSRAPPSSDQSSRRSHHRKDLRAHRSWHLRRKERCGSAPYAMQPASIAVEPAAAIRNLALRWLLSAAALRVAAPTTDLAIIHALCERQLVLIGVK